MSKKEKYIEYVIDDLISKTTINKETRLIKFPFLNSSHWIRQFLQSPDNVPENFGRYLKNVYGAMEEETQDLWGEYKVRILSLINDE